MPKGKEADSLLENQEGEPLGTSQAEVAVRGKGRTVGDALKKAGLKDQAKDLKGRFHELLKDAKNKIVAQRIFPRNLRNPADGKMYDCADVVEMPPPMTLDEIVNNLREEYGGKKWNIRVQDEDGETIDARNVDVPGEPRRVHRAEDDFVIPDAGDLSLGGDGKDGVEVNPLDNEIENRTKEGQVLLLEQQNARLRSQIADLSGNGHRKNGEQDTAKLIADALSQQDARHRAELADRDKKNEMTEMERRLRDDTNQRFNDLKGMIEKMQAGNPAQTSGLSDLKHSVELLQTSMDNKIDKALGQYREMTNQQINALEKGMDGKLNAIQTSLSTIQNHRPDNPMKDVIPLITSSIERSTGGYKEMMSPIIKMLTDKQEAEAAPPANPLEDTLETLGKFNLLGDRKNSGDFGSRVVDFAEKMGPEVMAFIRDERKSGREVTETALKNHLKLQAEKISREVSAAAAKEIRAIKAEQSRPGLPAPAAQTTGPQGQKGASPVGSMSPEEIAARTPKPAAPTPAASAPAPAPVASAPAAPPPVPAQKVARPPQPEPEEEEEGEPLTVEEEMSDRVDSTLDILEREMKIRPRQITWPNAAWDDLPAEVLDQIIYANDEEDVYKAIEPYADKELSERIWAIVRADPKAKEFIVAGINLIKGWAVELQEKQRAAAGVAPAEEPPPAQ